MCSSKDYITNAQCMTKFRHSK